MTTPIASHLTDHVDLILVPVAESPHDHRTVAAAAALAAALDAELDILHVVPDPGPATTALASSTPSMVPLASPPRMDDLKERASERLAQLAAKVVPPQTPHRVRVRAGSPRSAIVDAARETDADLVVMASHRRDGLARVLGGSVTEHVMRKLDIPVLVLAAEDQAANDKDTERAATSAAPDSPRDG